MDHDYYAAYIRRQLTRIQYDSKSATSNAHYQLGLLIGVIAQAAVQDSRVLDLVRATLERNEHRV
jgi:cobalamin biosynthesis protein CbiG